MILREQFKSRFWGSLTYKKLSVGKLLIYMQRSFFLKFKNIRMKNIRVMDYMRKRARKRALTRRAFFSNKTFTNYILSDCINFFHKVASKHKEQNFSLTFSVA